ncbi:MAG: alpha-ketoglutarate-dependent dioxygenase AlkB [Actinomycetota bacterium]|nr:alpha-ketoglutarate-dependent dioxygenase AlkB [Actinomycetota bacterium]
MSLAVVGAWQASLLSEGAPAVDAQFSGLVRHELDSGAWVDHCAGWLSGANDLIEELLTNAGWQGHDRVMYGERVLEPRLRASYDALAPVDVVQDAARLLSARYGVAFDSVGLNLYRNGRDSVAWHGDRIPRDLAEPLVATLTLGERRRFLLRPKGGGRSIDFSPASGDLIVMGGTAQRTWQHSVPKVAAAGPRISVTFRHWVVSSAYRTRT